MQSNDYIEKRRYKRFFPGAIGILFFVLRFAVVGVKSDENIAFLLT
jgi:hypothetical protein